MRALGQPEVLRSAAIAAFVSSAMSCPRLLTAPGLKYPVWYLEAVLFLGGIFLWGFVFAWHTKYTHRPVITFKVDPMALGTATVAGAVGAVALYLLVDPAVRAATPQDYPATVWQWLATALFSLGFTQLFLVFAPFAWCVRLFRSTETAAVLTVLFGVFVLVVKHYHSPTPAPAMLFAELLLVRAIAGALSVYFFLRGGLFLALWCDLLVQSRYLLDLV